MAISQVPITPLNAEVLEDVAISITPVDFYGTVASGNAYTWTLVSAYLINLVVSKIGLKAPRTSVEVQAGQQYWKQRRVVAGDQQITINLPAVRADLVEGELGWLISTFDYFRVTIYWGAGEGAYGNEWSTGQNYDVCNGNIEKSFDNPGTWDLTFDLAYVASDRHVD